MRRSLVLAAVAAAYSAFTGAAGSALNPEIGLVARQPSVVPLHVAVPCAGPVCGVSAVRNLVFGVFARPHVQQPRTAPARQQVVRPRVLVPGQLRSGAR